MRCFALSLLSLLALSSLVNAEPPKTLPELSAGGVTYRGVTVSKIEPDGIKIVHDEGFAKIRIEDLSEEQRRLFELHAVQAPAGFASLHGKNAAAADSWLGKPLVLRDGSRNYTYRDYSIIAWFNAGILSKITIDIFPADKTPSKPQDVATLIAPGTTVGALRKKGILEEYSMTTPDGQIWEVSLTPGDRGYAVANLIPPSR